MPSYYPFPAGPMQVSIVICTYNRASLIRRALTSMQFMLVPPGLTWEIVVVNNSSNDMTALLAPFARRLPLKYVSEPITGVSRSRNAGAAASSGDLLLFTDDDVLVEPDWMTAWLAAAARWPDATYFAGFIRPHFADDVPDWLRRNPAALVGMLSALDLGSEPRWLESTEYPWGPNMAVRRGAFALASFDVSAGRIGKAQRRGSEYGFFRALSLLGATGRWEPAAKVRHYIPRERAHLRYFLRYYLGTGRFAAHRLYPALPSLRTQVRILRDSLRTLVELPPDWPRHLANLAWGTGRLLETRRLTRAGRPVERNPSGRTD